MATTSTSTSTTTTIDETRFACSLPPISISQPHPWLLVRHGKRRQTYTFFSISQNRRIVRTIPELRNKEIWASCNEWVVLADHESSSSSCSSELSLLSLISLEKIQLPKIKFNLNDAHKSCVLSSPPSSPDCRVVVVVQDDSPISRLFYCKPGDSEFKAHEYNLGNDGDNDAWAYAVALDGNLYVITSIEYLYTIDFNTTPEEPQPRVIRMTDEDQPTQQPRDIVSYSSLLVESNGELLFVKVMYYGIGLHFKEVFGFLINRFDFVEKEWVELKSLGKDRALFINEHWGISCLATEETGVKGNSIYFVKEHDRCLYVFDLEKKTISFSMPCPYANRRSSRFQWINLPHVNNI